MYGRSRSLNLPPYLYIRPAARHLQGARTYLCIFSSIPLEALAFDHYCCARSSILSSAMDRRYSNRLLLLHGLILMVALLPIPCHCRCNFPAIFNFGDSTSDTGAIHYAFPNNEAAENPPYGETYFGRPAYRYSDGRLSIDFFGMLLSKV